jgi:hypothetical protein
VPIFPPVNCGVPAPFAAMHRAFRAAAAPDGLPGPVEGVYRKWPVIPAIARTCRACARRQIHLIPQLLYQIVFIDRTENTTDQRQK